jgi:hypothetical protein
MNRQCPDCGIRHERRGEEETREGYGDFWLALATLLLLLGAFYVMTLAAAAYAQGLPS